MTIKVKLKNISKVYDLYEKKSDKFLSLFRVRNKEHRQFMALNNVSFEVSQGETVGLIGLNGSGKSTLSNILGGVLQPSDGSIEVNGKSSLIAISAGLNNNLSGLDNIELKCIMHGLSKEEIEKVRDDIIEFADIGDYIYQPVKDYSSGMKSRLGFAISVHTDPDILIIDEALSVGDSTFTQKCLKKMREFQDKGKTIFFVSHSAEQMRTFCEKIVWLHYGKVKEIGESNEVVKHYQEFTKWFNNLSNEEKKEYKSKQLSEQNVVGFRRNENKQEMDKYEWLKNSLVLIPLAIMGLLMVLN
ncbi:teichoic acid transport system ATP-binding protein [Gracilibacillus halotolerans]|uniref:Teichoic acid transport system ATP-binding protein n=1 Tax=Gracilibacillus halotolerans TaxID=74386 RepID=A0A841RM63_9BACI|nr:ATP-binding cassette domain-containing protein [Gracilibacillus halotolerans]MBB6513589.1 teichoic acid transport system ATP-binding protein [Gracilibacillus halotolerans]